MKRLLVAAAFLLALSESVPLSAQENPAFVLRLPEEEKKEKISVPFCIVKVLDARYDQAYIGCISPDLSFKGATKRKTLARFPEAFSLYMEKAAHRFLQFDSTSRDTLAVLVKQFRLADRTVSQIATEFDPETVIHASLSFYKADANGYAKISAAEELMAQTWTLDEVPIDVRRSQAVALLVERLFQNKNWTAGSQRFPAAQVQEGIRRRRDIPLFGAAVPVAGVYRNFEEFKNNAPSLQHFRFSQPRYGTVQEIRDAQDNVVSPDEVWGFCDGKDRYVSFQKAFHQLLPGPNSFRISFYRRRSEDGSSLGRTVDGPLDILVMPGFTRVMKPEERQEFLFLNLESGEMHVEEVIGTQPLRKFRNKSRQY